MGAVDITVIDHPLAAERLTILREASTPNAEFRAALDGLAGMLVYEATRLLPSQEVQVTTPLGPAYGRRLSTVPMLVPILRAGVGLVNGALRLLPSAEVGFVGLARDEETFLPPPTWPSCRTGWRSGRASSSIRCWPPEARSSTRAASSSSGARPSRSPSSASSPRPKGSTASAARASRPASSPPPSTATSTTRPTSSPASGDAGDRQFGLW